MSSADIAPKDPTADLPPEVLAHVFVWLHFLDRVRVACVCRYWRSTALQFPALWSDVRLLDGRRRNSLIQLTQLALSRSARRPVDLECGADITAPILREHLDHIRTLLWVGSNMDPLSAPAPMLEHFRCATNIPFPHDFLGGQLGVLRVVEMPFLVLPPACPALGTVTSIYADTQNVDLAPALDRLWLLCPRLELLHLRDLPTVPLGSTTPPPQTLARLELRTASRECDVGQYVSACASGALKEVRITLPMQASLSLAAFLRRAQELSIEPGDPRLREGVIKSSTARLPDGCSFRLAFSDADEGHRNDLSVERVLAEGAQFPDLTALTMPLLIFHLFIRKRPHFPALRRLCIVVQQEAGGGVSRFDWTRIYCLSFLKHYAVETVTFDVRYLTDVEDTIDDARTLVTHILHHTKALAERTYVVRGFPDDVAQAMNVRRCERGPRIVFESDGD